LKKMGLVAKVRWWVNWQKQGVKHMATPQSVLDAIAKVSGDADTNVGLISTAVLSTAALAGAQHQATTDQAAVVTGATLQAADLAAAHTLLDATWGPQVTPAAPPPVAPLAAGS
jgi:hypothetical protein